MQVRRSPDLPLRHVLRREGGVPGPGALRWTGRAADTPRSGGGTCGRILEEVRWELDAAGYPEVQIVLSAGVTRNEIIAYRDIVDAFGVGGRLPMPRWWTLPWISSLLTGCPVPSVAKRAGPSRSGKCGRAACSSAAGHPGSEGGTPLISTIYQGRRGRETPSPVCGQGSAHQIPVAAGGTGPRETGHGEHPESPGSR